MSVIKRNNVNVFGAGERVLMFAHGFGCDQVMWRYIYPAFENDYKIILFDYVGCGRSEIAEYNEQRYGSLQGYALDVLEICSELNLKDVIFIGHSVSSIIGMLASIQKPQVFRALVLVCPSACYINKPGYFGGFEERDLVELLDIMDSNYVGWSSYLAPVVMKNMERPELTEELAESFCSMDKEITRNFAKVTFFSDNREDLSKVRPPCLVLQCAEDDIASERVGEFIHAQLARSTMVYMKATGHCPHLSHPEETIDRIQNFLSKEMNLT